MNEDDIYPRPDLYVVRELMRQNMLPQSELESFLARANTRCPHTAKYEMWATIITDLRAMIVPFFVCKQCKELFEGVTDYMYQNRVTIGTITKNIKEGHREPIQATGVLLKCVN